MNKCVTLILTALLAITLAACSRSETTFDATGDLDGGPPEAKAVLKLAGFNDTSATSGTGTLTIEAVAGRARSGPVGVYAVNWYREVGSVVYQPFSVSVPAAHAGLDFKPMPTGGLGDTVYWCLSCERFKNGVGDLISLPGIYAKQG